ncbi:MAG: flagellar hook capping FlgD N-terminal domain-containing protein, partial [Paracoccaceae bacterium]
MTSLTDPITTSNITHRAPAQPPKVEDSSTALTSDFETYLKMLTVQMENQDPLDPADASEFSVQLATFSSLEQQVYGNQLLEQMIASAGQSGGLDMVNLLGREALVDENATFTGTPIAVRIPDLPDHDTAVLRVENDFGGSFATQPLDKNARSIQWPPSADLGTTPHASYRFVI